MIGNNSQQDQKLNKFVDSFFLPSNDSNRHQENHRCNKTHAILGSQEVSGKGKYCSICQHVKCCREQNNYSELSNFQITQEDIDAVELLYPKIAPNDYMTKIVTLEHREQGLACRQTEHEVMRCANPAKILATYKTIIENQLLQKQKKTIREKMTEKKITLKRNIKENKAKRQNGLNKSVKFSLGCIEEQKEEESVEVGGLLRQENQQILRVRRLKDSCFIGLGKQIVKQEVNDHTVKLGRSNYHTRQYLLPAINEHIKRLEDENEEKGVRGKVYIIANANSKGINFDIESVPTRLEKHIDFNRYRQIFYCINEIIQKTAYQAKTKSKAGKSISKGYSMLGLLLFLSITIYILNQQYIMNEEVEIGSLIVTPFLMILALIMSFHRFMQKVDVKPIDESISEQIDNYFHYVNTRGKLSWSTGLHLYWIEIKIKPEYLP